MDKVKDAYNVVVEFDFDKYVYTMFLITVLSYLFS